MRLDRLLEEIKSRIDIVEFISDYVQLKKSGQNYKGLCPFHPEKRASFMVSQSKQIFHCFGCGIGGDVISFLIKHDNLSFNEALRYIAKRAGINIEKYRFNKVLSERREGILQINKEAMKFFIKNLHSSDVARAYLRSRGIEESSLHTFSIGYATDERDCLIRYLKKRGYSDSLIKDAGLAISDEKGYRDFFRGRIIFPIFNYQNDVIAFGGRAIDGYLPKYLNSPETEVFKKAETLFALNLAKEEIRKNGFAIIVEGYPDVIACYQHGFKNTVAPLGTALTSKHLQKIRSLAGKVVLVFDNDEAGLAAARRSLKTLCECDLRASILLLPAGEDPDSFLRKNGKEPFEKMLSEAMSMIEFLLNTSTGERIDTVKEALGMIALMKDLIVAEELLCELADRSRISESVLRSELKKIKRRGLQTVNGLRQDKTKMNKEERLLLSTIIAFPEKAEVVLSKLDIEDLKDETIRSLFKKIKRLSSNFNISSILAEADDAEKSLITELSLEAGFDLELVDKNIDDCLQTIALKKFDEKMRKAEESGDIALLNSLLMEKRKLIRGC